MPFIQNIFNYNLNIKSHTKPTMYLGMHVIHVYACKNNFFPNRAKE